MRRTIVALTGLALAFGVSAGVAFAASAVGQNAAAAGRVGEATQDPSPATRLARDYDRDERRLSRERDRSRFDEDEDEDDFNDDDEEE